MERRKKFLDELWSHYRVHGRHDLPWRVPDSDGTLNPYHILVSEIMLQQTQVSRVIPKYEIFLKRFPTVRQLAEAPLGEVLISWQGLGYNRRAKFLWQAAQITLRDYDGELPDDSEALEGLPGIGRNTAGAIRAYAFNQPTLFIETNIRTAYIHHFFHDQQGVPDRSIMELLSQTLDRTNPREFYWALMDYGSYLKQTVGNLCRASRAYARQPKFHGSLRQIRGQVLRMLATGQLSEGELSQRITDDRLEAVLDALEREGLINRSQGYYHLP